MIGNSLSMVARRSSDNALLFVLFAEREHLVASAALLEGAGSLQGLQLQVDVGVRELLGEHVASDERGEFDLVADTLSGGLDVSKSEHGFLGGHSFLACFCFLRFGEEKRETVKQI